MTWIDFQYFTCNIKSCGFLTKDLHKFVEHCTEENYFSKYFKKGPVFHDQVEPFKCYDCKYSTEIHEDLEKHVTENHDGEMKKDTRHKLICRSCLFETKEVQIFIQHCQNYEHSQEGDFKCQNCNFKTKTFCALEDHAKEKHEDRKAFSCEICNTEYTKHERFAYHMSTKHGVGKEVKMATCSICMGKYPKQMLKKHMKTAHGETEKPQRINCDICGESYASKTGLTNHINRQHLAKSKEKKYSCDVCDFKTTTRQIAKEHKVRMHTTEARFECEKCDFKTKLKRDLKVHDNKRHREKVCSLDYKCNVCLKHFPNSSALRLHVMSHDKSNRKDLPCELCDYATIDLARLKNHVMQKHRSEKAFKCDQCGKAFKLKLPLDRHKRLIHEKDKCKVHKCDKCDFSTIHESSMKRHRISFHGGAVSGLMFEMKCPVCNIALKSKAGLKMHIKRIHEEKSLMCSSCDYSTNVIADLLKHMSNKHE